MAVLFGILSLGLLLIAAAAWRGGLWPAAIGAAALAVWMATFAASAVRRRRRR